MTRLTFLQKHNTSEPIVQVPEIHTANTTLVIQLSVNIEGFIRSDLHLPNSLARYCALACALIVPLIIYTSDPSASKRGLEFARPGRAVAISITVIIAEEIISAGLSASRDSEGLIDGGEEVFCEGGDKGDEGV